MLVCETDKKYFLSKNFEKFPGMLSGFCNALELLVGFPTKD